MASAATQQSSGKLNLSVSSEMLQCGAMVKEESCLHYCCQSYHHMTQSEYNASGSESSEGQVSIVTEQSRFTRWVRKYSPRRGLICHFYIREKAKPFYGKVEFAYFNLFCPSKDWVVGGTKNHGISSMRRKKSQIPCLNCFDVSDEFCSAIKEYKTDRDGRFDIGIILNKRKLKRDFTVIDVSEDLPFPLPPPNRCHHFDNVRFRVSVLRPFHYCHIVRVEIPERNQLPAVSSIRWDSIAGMLVKPEHRDDIAEALQCKGLTGVEIFAVL